jgi:transposase
MNIREQIQEKFEALEPVLNERQIRLWAAAEASAQGYGGVMLVSEATGISRTTITRGLWELDQLWQTPPVVPARVQRIRQPGAGRKPIEEKDPGLLEALDKLIQPTQRGDPQSALRWTCKSTYQLAEELTHQGHPVSPRTVSDLLQAQGYSLQSNRKTLEGSRHPDRNAQFEHIHAQVERFQQQGQPVVSVDTKKKELIGNFKNAGQEWQPSGCPQEVQIHDFVDPKRGKAIPYGVYDLAANAGFVTVGTDHDTAEFAVQSLRNWWYCMGHSLYPDAKHLLITADCGGSNSASSRLWKVELQDLADETGLSIWVCHFPPGTSKWNKIEHRLFCHITENWRGRPLIDHETIVQLIGNTTTKTGLKVEAQLDTDTYATGIEITDEELAQVRMIRAEFHGDWNYVIQPRTLLR